MSVTPIGNHGPTAISFPSHRPPPYPDAAARAQNKLPGAGLAPRLSRPMSAGRS